MGKARAGSAGGESTSGDQGMRELEMGSESWRSQSDSASPKGQFRESGGAWACWGRVRQQLRAIPGTKGGRGGVSRGRDQSEGGWGGCLGVSRKLHGARSAAEWGCSNPMGAAAHLEKGLQWGRAEAKQSIS